MFEKLKIFNLSFFGAKLEIEFSSIKDIREQFKTNLETISLQWTTAIRSQPSKSFLYALAASTPRSPVNKILVKVLQAVRIKKIMSKENKINY
ncbi:hypothetical protein V2J09_006271 [Rumex salicifolius]